MSERSRFLLRLTWSDQGEHIDTREDRNARAAACLECTSRDHAKLHHGFRGISNWSWKSHRRQSPGVDSSRSERDRCKGTNSEICAESWERLDEVDLDVLFLQKIPMLKNCPRFFRGRLRHCPIWDSVKAAMSVRAKAEAKSVIAQGADQMRACATRVNGEW